MKVLIVAKFWDASAGIAALRPMKIAKYLLKDGHEVAVICGKEYASSPDPCRDLTELRKNRNYTEIPAFTYSSFIEKEDRLYKKRNSPSNGKAAENKGDKAEKGLAAAIVIAVRFG